MEKTLESPLDCKEIQPVHSKGDQSWVFFGRNDAKAETSVLWPPHGKSWLIGKDSNAGRDWGQKKKGMTEDEMAGWHHGLDGRESELTPGDGDGQGGLACCNSWGCKELDTTEWLNWTELREDLDSPLWSFYLFSGKISFGISLVVFPTFSNLSLKFANKTHDLTHGQLQVLCLLTVNVSPPSVAKNIINLISVLISCDVHM